MKKLNLLILIILAPIICGFTCEYNIADENKMDLIGLSKISFSGDRNSINATFYGSNSEKINTYGLGENITALTESIRTLQMLSSEDFFDYYTNKGCPANIFIYSYNMDPTLYSMSYVSPDGEFTSVSFSSTNQSGGTLDSNPNSEYKGYDLNAQRFQDYEIRDKNSGKVIVCIELGFSKYNDNTVDRYIAVANTCLDLKSRNGAIDYYSDDNELNVTYNRYSYLVLNPDMLYFNNNGNYSFITQDKIDFANAPGEDIYYIRSKDDTGNAYEGSEMEVEAEKIDPGILDTPNPSKPQLPIDPNVKDFCSSTGVLKAFQIVGYLLFVVKILVPLILIVLGSIDFGKAALSSDDKAISQAAGALARRVVIGIIIFLIPTVLDYLLSLVDKAGDTASNYTSCTNCLLTPFDSSCKAKNIGE